MLLVTVCRCRRFLLNAFSFNQPWIVSSCCPTFFCPNLIWGLKKVVRRILEKHQLTTFMLCTVLWINCKAHGWFRQRFISWQTASTSRLWSSTISTWRVANVWLVDMVLVTVCLCRRLLINVLSSNQPWVVGNCYPTFWCPNLIREYKKILRSKSGKTSSDQHLFECCAIKNSYFLCSIVNI